VLQGKSRFLRGSVRALCACALACASAATADAPLEPVSTCEVLRDLPSYEGKSAAIFGRYSYRSNGRWIGEQACSPPIDAPPQLWLLEDSRDGPHPPADFEIDAAQIRRKFADISKRTQLGKFRFGTPDYDRWAVVYGRVEQRKGEDAKRAPANLVIRGSGVIVFVSPEL
jgi:hypothetical protein